MPPWIGVARLGLVGCVLIGLALSNTRRPAPRPPPVIIVPPSSAPAPIPPPAPTLDRAAVAKAEAAVESARRERTQAEARVEEAARALEAATLDRARSLASARSLLTKVRDPRARIASATARGGLLRIERDKIKAQLAALDGTPKPRAKPLIDKSPVARESSGDEFHFEIRGDRIAFIDLDRLLDRVKSDARLRLRMAESFRPIEGTVGPVGSFSIQYKMGRLGGETVGDAISGRNVTYSLLGWEVIPESEGRGETLAQTTFPASEFARAVGRLNPERDTLTFWVYPDGFPLYRQIRDRLHSRGFLVAARPMPDSMPIRGSPMGSNSAGQ